MDQDVLQRKIVTGQLHYGKPCLACVALHCVSWNKMLFKHREVTRRPKGSAPNYIMNPLDSPTYSCVPAPLACCGWGIGAVIANLFPAELDLGAINVQVELFCELLPDVAAERYTLTLRITLANLRQKVGLVPNEMLPLMAPGVEQPMMAPPPPFLNPSIVSPPAFTVEELGMWAGHCIMFNPSLIVRRMQE